MSQPEKRSSYISANIYQNQPRVLLTFISIVFFQVKTCLTYDTQANKLVYKDQPTCTDQFKWLDNYILYHIGSRLCVSPNLVLTHDCYSAISVQFKLKNGLMKNINGRCWGREQGAPAKTICEDTLARFEFH